MTETVNIGRGWKADPDPIDGGRSRLENAGKLLGEARRLLARAESQMIAAEREWEAAWREIHSKSC